MAGGRLFGFALVALLVALIAIEPVPEDWQQPWKTRVLLASWKLSVNLGNMVDALGYSGPSFRRALVDALFPYVSPASHLSGVTTEDTLIEGVPVRLYMPADATENPEIRPAIIFYHGGGWTIGSVVSHDNVVKRMVKDLGVYAVSVGYRLAPEHTYPTPLDDCVAVTKYMLTNAAKFSVDSSRVALAGDSAGGNFAVAVSLRLRDEKFPIMPKLQVLIYPSLQLIDFNTPSYQANKDGPLMTAEHVGEFTGYYLQGHRRNAKDLIRNRHVDKSVVDDLRSKYLRLDDLPDDDIKRNYKPEKLTEKSELWNGLKDAAMSPYASPLIADDLSGLPYAYILACQYDVLRDDAVWFARRLGPKAHLSLQRCFHGCVNFGEDLTSSDLIMQEMIEFIRKNL